MLGHRDAGLQVGSHQSRVEGGVNKILIVVAWVVSSYCEQQKMVGRLADSGHFCQVEGCMAFFILLFTFCFLASWNSKLFSGIASMNPEVFGESDLFGFSLLHHPK